MVSNSKLSTKLNSDENKDNPDAIIARKILANSQPYAKDAGENAKKEIAGAAAETDNSSENKTKIESSASRFKSMLTIISDSSNGKKLKPA